MIKLNKEELLNVDGGAITASLINSFARAGSLLLELGRSLGSAIRRLYSGKTC